VLAWAELRHENKTRGKNAFQKRLLSIVKRAQRVSSVCFCFNPTSRGPCTIVCGSCIGPVSMLHGRSRLITSRQRGSVCERESGGHIFIAAACVRSHEKTTRGKMKQTHVPSASSEILYCFPQKRQSRSLDAKKKIFFNERLQVKGDYGVF
jgi:hypothetical protein